MNATLPPKPPTTPHPTQERLLDAAVRVFAKDGLHGATTREIAAEAGVNEVTLFRHFQNKENLLAAVFRRAAALYSEAIADAEDPTHDLHRDLLRCARRYHELLETNQALIRMLIGEASRYPEHARRMIQESIQPLRTKLVGYLQAGITAGVVRADLEVIPAVDIFTGILLAGMLRRTSQCTPAEYSRNDYITTAVEIFVRGIQAEGSK